MAELELQPPETGQPVGYIELVRGNRNYRSLWMGEVISLFGDWFDLIASAALVSTLTRSGLAVGGLFVVRMLAPFLISPLAGVVADRYNRKMILVLSDLTRFVVVLGYLLVRDPAHIWLLYTLTAVHLGISGFFTPARSAILPDLVSRRELGAANALSSATWSTMLAFGAALGGLVAGRLGIYPAFVVDSFSFLISAMLISRIRYGENEGSVDDRRPATADRSEAGGGRPSADGGRVSMHPRVVLGHYLDGLRYLKHHLDVLALAMHKGAVSLVANGAFQVIQVALAERVFVIGQGGSTSLGLLYAVAGVGTGLGPILARRITRDRDQPMRQALALSYLGLAAGVAISATLASFGVVLFGTFLRAFAGGINWVFSTQLLFHSLPGQVRGRVFASEFAIFTLANATSTAAAGWALDRTSLGIGGMLWGMAGLSLVPGVLWTVWMVREGAWGQGRRGAGERS